jgi:hypothetical protein
MRISECGSRNVDLQRNSVNKPDYGKGKIVWFSLPAFSSDFGFWTQIWFTSLAR